MFCENEKSIQPKTHICVSKSKPNMSQSRCFAENSTMSTLKPDKASKSYKNESECSNSSIPLSKSVSLQAFSSGNSFSENVLSSKFSDSPKTKNNPSYWVTTDKFTSTSTPYVKTTQIDAPMNASLTQTSFNPGCNRYNKYDSESSSSSDLIDLTSRNNVPIGEMYNDDIDYMNNYLKSLPDYNELNRKISNEQQKCEDIYDRLLCINSSLKSNLLPKSNSYHSISTALATPHQSLSAQSSNNAKNKIIRSSSSSVVNQNLLSNRNHTGVTPIKLMDQIQIKSRPYEIVKSKSKQESSPTNPDFNEKFKLQNKLPTTNCTLNKSLQRSNSKKGLNDFWSENLAKTNQQKMGWNYDKIMANKLDSFKSNNSYNISPSNGYKLQKNMSLSQLGQRIQQNVSREELYNLICNNEPERSLDSNIGKIDCNSLSKIEAAPKLTLSRSTQILKTQSMQQSYVPTGMINPLAKSISQTIVPSPYVQIMKMKSPRINTIPTLFKPLCKSSSNTHVFGHQDKFTPRNLMKSASSSSIFNTTPGNPNANIQLVSKCSINNINNISKGSKQGDRPKGFVNIENNNTMNDQQIKTQNADIFHGISSSNGPNAETEPTARTFNQFNSIFTQSRKKPDSKYNVPMSITKSVPSLSLDTNIMIPRKLMNNR